MELSTSSISNEISKEIQVQEDFSLSRASIEEARMRKDQAEELRSLSNERIRKGDIILETYVVMDDAISGGMGSVWRVHHQGWDIDLAMKRPQPKYFAEGGPRRKEEFISECENWINLGLHPNIVSCYYVREIGGVPTIFSEWMDGGSLRDKIRDGSLYEGSEEEIRNRILDIAIQAARGLAYSHENGLVHQDVKPGNLLLTQDWKTKVADFGLAKAREKLSEGGAVQSTGYTREYCPREQEEGAEAQPWMDTYAWGLTVLEMFAGKRLWESGSDAIADYDTYWDECRIPVSESLRGLLETCVVQEEDYHPANFADICADLEKIYLEETGTPYFRPVPQAARNNSSYLNNRALSFLDLGMNAAGEKEWEEALKLNAADKDASANRLLYRWRQGRMDDREFAKTMHSLLDGNSEDKDQGAEFDFLLEKEKSVLTVAAEYGGDHFAKMAAVSPDGSKYAIDGNTITVYRSADNSVLFQTTFSSANGLRFTNDSRTLCVFIKGDLVLLDAETGERRGYLRCPSFGGGANIHNAIYLSPDGEKLVLLYDNAGSLNNYLLEVKISDVTPVRGQSLNKLLAVDACFHPDGKSVLMLDGSKDKCIQFSLESWKRIREYDFVPYHAKDEDLEEDKYVNYHAFSVSPDGKTIVTGTDQGSILVWDAEEGKLREEFTLSSSNIGALQILPDGKTLIAGNKEGFVCAVPLDGGRPAVSREFGEWVRDIALLEDGTFAVTAESAKIQIYRYDPDPIDIKHIPMRLSRIASYEALVDSFSRFTQLRERAADTLSQGNVAEALALLEEAEACEYKDAGLLRELYLKALPLCTLKGIKDARKVNVYRTGLGDEVGHLSKRSVFFFPETQTFLTDLGSSARVDVKEPVFTEAYLSSTANEVFRLTAEGDRIITVSGTQLELRDPKDKTVKRVGYAASRSVKDAHASGKHVLAVLSEKEKSCLAHFVKARDDLYDRKTVFEVPKASAWGGVQEVSIAGDFYYVSVGDTITKYRLKDDKQVLSFDTEPSLQHFAVSSDGKVLAFGRWIDSQPKVSTELVLADTQTGKVFRRIPVNQHIRNVIWTFRDLLLLCLQDGEVWLIDRNAQDPVLHVYSDGTKEANADSAAFSDDFRYLVVMDSSCVITLWENDWRYEVGECRTQVKEKSFAFAGGSGSGDETVSDPVEQPKKKGFFSRLFGR